MKTNKSKKSVWSTDDLHAYLDEAVHSFKVGPQSLWPQMLAILTSGDKDGDSEVACAIAARWCIVLCDKGILHLGARGHREAPVHQWRGAWGASTGARAGGNLKGKIIASYTQVQSIQ
jgi:hypothetical protein